MSKAVAVAFDPGLEPTVGNQVCILCRVNEGMKKNFLCAQCSTDIQNKPELLDSYRMALRKNKKHSLIVKAAAEQNEPVVQLKARKIVTDIVGWFGMHVKKEHAFPPYVVDLYVPELRLAIEIDGNVHESRSSYDEKRDKILSSKYGVTVYRFYAHQVKSGYFKQAVFDSMKQAHLRKLGLAIERAKNAGVLVSRKIEEVCND